MKVIRLNTDKEIVKVKMQIVKVKSEITLLIITLITPITPQTPRLSQLPELIKLTEFRCSLILKTSDEFKIELKDYWL